MNLGVYNLITNNCVHTGWCYGLKTHYHSSQSIKILFLVHSLTHTDYMDLAKFSTTEEVNKANPNK